MPETARTYANMLKIQAAQRQAGLVGKPQIYQLPVAVVPAVASAGVNLSNFTPAQLAHLSAVAASMRPRQTELERSYGALKKAESTGKKYTRRNRKRRQTMRRGKRT